ncbi:arylsulfatase [Candidatus Poribacteria bacterium]|nr:arylsulfatase [Candidatus Poribacteria bacterium]
MKRPNFMLILCDQMRGDCLGADGNPVIQTPNLDYLAACGTRFTHAYSATPSCLPARASLWTGQNQWHTGILGMGWGQGPIPHDFPHTIAGEFTKAGYTTHLVGKGHFTPQRALMGFETTEIDESGRTLINGFKDDYREWFDINAPDGVSPDDHGVDWNSWLSRPWHTYEYLHPTAWTMTKAIEFLKNRDKSKPFFLNISFARPHSPYAPPEPYFDMYMYNETPPPAVGKWSEMHNKPEDAIDPNAWRGKMTPEQIHRARSGYYGEITFIDTQIGRLMNWIRRFQREDFQNTWFIFTSDHGDMQGDHNLWRKTYAYEGSSRIPFIITPPAAMGRPALKIAHEVVELRDIMPTLLDAAGLNTPRTIDGVSLLPTMKEEQSNWRRYIHGEHCTCYSREQEMQYVTNGWRKFIWLPRINQEQFFDLEQDPNELNNLIGNPERQDEIDTWRKYLIYELNQRDCGWVKDNKLYCPLDKPLISTYKDKRWQGEHYE